MLLFLCRTIVETIPYLLGIISGNRIILQLSGELFGNRVRRLFVFKGVMVVVVVCSQ